MNSFLKSIGFSEIKNKKGTNQLIASVIEDPTEKHVIMIDADTTLVQMNRNFGEEFGISVVGEIDENSNFNVDYCFPYVIGNQICDQEEIQIEKHYDRESYAGVAEDVNVGVSLIFYLQNITDYVKRQNSNEFYALPNQVVLSALAMSGSIILEINKNEKQLANEKAGNLNRNNLLQAARDGDLEAIESLTLDDMDTYTIISRRAKKEDVLTIVDSYFMPFGIESDQYSILGNILDAKQVKNSVTSEIIHILQIECNNLIFNMAVNAKDLLGEPIIGRRFKGSVWLQGRAIFDGK